MRILRLLLTIFVLIGLCSAQLPLQVYPSTTSKTAETAPNTSASPTFAGWTNGNMPASNISKENIKTLLSNPNAALFAEIQAWWGQSNHPNVGYSNNTASHSDAMVADMQSRGLDGTILDWYGIGHYTDKVATLLKASAEKKNFKFILMIDGGTIKWNVTCPGCTSTDTLIKALKYFETTYYPSTAYYRINGKPVVMFFGVDSYAPDYAAIRAAIPNALILSRNGGSFGNVNFDGAYAWLGPTKGTTNPAYDGFAYYKDFYYWWGKYPSKIGFSSAYKGFDDTMANWSEDRHIFQMCGQTWLNSFKQSPATTTLYQIATWDDYEEGTEIETGIDNCLTLTANKGVGAITWDITGNENTLTRYEIFASLDGGNHMWKLGTAAVGQRSYTLPKFKAAVTVFVKAIGKPSIVNHLSNGVTF